MNNKCLDSNVMPLEISKTVVDLIGQVRRYEENTKKNLEGLLDKYKTNEEDVNLVWDNESIEKGILNLEDLMDRHEDITYRISSLELELHERKEEKVQLEVAINKEVRGKDMRAELYEDKEKVTDIFLLGKIRDCEYAEVIRGLTEIEISYHKYLRRLEIEA